MELIAVGYVHARILVRCQKIVGLLETQSYIKAKDVARRLRIPLFKVYGAIRKLREIFNVGITNTPRGYILSKDATMRDDAYQLRLLLARRNSILITLASSLPYINRRWHRQKDKQQLRTILPHLSGDRKKLKSGLSVCLAKSGIHKV